MNAKAALSVVVILTAVILAANRGAVENYGWDRGALQSDSVAIVSGCDSNLIYKDTVKVWADAIAAACSLYCDSGKIVYQWASDTAGTIGRDSVTGKDAPYLHRDTSTVLAPSTDYWVRFCFDADTGITMDTTKWTKYTTQDSSDTSDWWYYEPAACTASVLTRAPTQTGTKYDAIVPMVHPWTGGTPDSIRLGVGTTLPTGTTMHPGTGTISGVPTDTTDGILALEIIGYSCAGIADTVYDSLRVRNRTLRVNPGSIDTSGGTLTLAGSGFGATPTVTVLGHAAASYVSRNDSTIVITVSAHAEETGDIAVTNGSFVQTYSGFSYSVNRPALRKNRLIDFTVKSFGF